jgi:hypothetical protein
MFNVSSTRASPRARRLPPGFTQALQFFENAFKVLVTMNQTWAGAKYGTAIAPGLGENIPGETGPLSFTEVQTALMANAAASGDSSLVNVIRTTDPTNGGQFVMSNGGQGTGYGIRNAASTDGWIAFSGNRNYTFNQQRTCPAATISLTPNMKYPRCWGAICLPARVANTLPSICCDIPRRAYTM